MFDSYLTEKMLASIKYRQPDDFIARSPQSCCGEHVPLVTRLLSHLGDFLLSVGYTLKRRYHVEQYAISI